MFLSHEERSSDSPFIERIWYSRSDRGGGFVSIANTRTEIVVTCYEGQTMLTIRGPETHATPAHSPAYAEHVGIVLKPGIFLPDFPVKRIRDRQDVTLPTASSTSFWLKGSTWEFPTHDNADTFVNRLAHDELLVQDFLVQDILRRRPIDISPRTFQRRFLQATGITHGTFLQIQRAMQAVALLTSGVSILDTVFEAGYADQPHMTRALKHFVSYTPAQLTKPIENLPMSFLFKNLYGEWDMLSALNTQPGGNDHEENRRLGIHLTGRSDRSA